MSDKKTLKEEIKTKVRENLVVFLAIFIPSAILLTLGAKEAVEEVYRPKTHVSLANSRDGFVETKVHVKAGEWKRVRRSELKSFDMVPMLKWRPVGGTEQLVVAESTVVPSDVTEVEFQSKDFDFAITLLVPSTDPRAKQMPR